MLIIRNPSIVENRVQQISEVTNGSAIGANALIINVLGCFVVVERTIAARIQRTKEVQP